MQLWASTYNYRVLESKIWRIVRTILIDKFYLHLSETFSPCTTSMFSGSSMAPIIWTKTDNRTISVALTNIFTGLYHKTITRTEVSQEKRIISQDKSTLGHWCCEDSVFVFQVCPLNFVDESVIMSKLSAQHLARNKTEKYLSVLIENSICWCCRSGVRSCNDPSDWRHTSYSYILSTTLDWYIH